ncbi:MAG: 8-oxo-dGTP diphosphatase [Subtercola sp.]|nr:8-oxo-dGTP diphosphatase [Subtercola sp.]
MTEQGQPSPHSFVPPRLHSAPGSGDGWVEDGTGRKFWGRFGAAGLLAHDPTRGILLQHRANWSHFGGTWGLPGGARHEGETAVQGAVREATEEAGIDAGALRIRMTSTLDLGFWSYTTVVVDVTTPFEAAATDAESIEVRWVPVADVAALPLHPGFEASWPVLQAELERRTVLIVDSANVVGSRPDGWWKDRVGATERLAGRLSLLARRGYSAAALGLGGGGSDGSGGDDGSDGSGDGLGGTHWWPETVLVVEGQARAARLDEASESVTAGRRDGTVAADIAASIELLPAEHDGDQAIVDAVAGVTVPARILVVTADRELGARVSALGATVLGPGWLLALLDEA